LSIPLKVVGSNPTPSTGIPFTVLGLILFMTTSLALDKPYKYVIISISSKESAVLSKIRCVQVSIEGAGIMDVLSFTKAMRDRTTSLRIEMGNPN